MGHEDARALWGEADDEAWLKQGAELGATIVVVKRAERGAVALAHGRIVEVPAYPVEYIADPVGAGDGFDAGFLSGWLESDDLETMLRLGARVGADAVTTLSDYAGYPKRANLTSRGW
jgi:2-dehydro-3-deoxygluconokinase